MSAISGSCHCGAVRIVVPSAPDRVTDCNCSLCRRLGALWAYYDVGTVRVEGHPERTSEYIWGDKTLRTVRCTTCGCITHWEPLNAAATGRQGVNIRNFDAKILASVTIRRFDGADTWKYLD